MPDMESLVSTFKGAPWTQINQLDTQTMSSSVFVGGDIQSLASIQKLLCAAYICGYDKKVEVYRRYVLGKDGLIECWQVDMVRDEAAIHNLVTFMKDDEMVLDAGSRPVDRVDYNDRTWGLELLSNLISGLPIKPIELTTLAKDKNQLHMRVGFSCAAPEQIKKVFTAILQVSPDTECLKKYIVFKEQDMVKLAQYYVIRGMFPRVDQILIRDALVPIIGEGVSKTQVDRAYFFQVVNGVPVPSGPRNIPVSSSMGSLGQKGVWTTSQKNIDIDIDAMQDE